MEGKISILVTGASSGIGKALVCRVANRFPDAAIVVVARREALLQELCDRFGARIMPVQADLAEASNRERLACAISESGIRLTHVIHNAGIAHPASRLRDLDLDEYRYQNRVNCEAPTFLTGRLLDGLVSEHGCRFLFVSSGAAFSPMVGLGSYCISKAALEMSSQVFRAEYAGCDKLLFASLRPGGVDTDIPRLLSCVPESVFPQAPSVKKRLEENSFLTPETSAEFIEHVLFDTCAGGYEGHWNINDPEMKNRKWYLGAET